MYILVNSAQSVAAELLRRWVYERHSHSTHIETYMGTANENVNGSVPAVGGAGATTGGGAGPLTGRVAGGRGVTAGGKGVTAGGGEATRGVGGADTSIVTILLIRGLYNNKQKIWAFNQIF